MATQSMQTRISYSSFGGLEINYVPSDRVDEFWPAVRDWISRAVSRTGEYDAEDIHSRLQTSKMLLWLVFEREQLVACMVTQTILYPSRHTLMVVCLGGERFWHWAQALDAALERYREELGLECIRAGCRPGMARWLKRLGWKPIMTVMER